LAATFLSPVPRNFQKTDPETLSRKSMIMTVTNGRPGTAMQSFTHFLSNQEIESVVDFVRLEFMKNRAINTRYHTAENGWPRHERYIDAYPFALGDLPLDTPDQELTKSQKAGKARFLSSCISCHDRAKVNNEGAIWEPRAVSFPRSNYSHRGSLTSTKLDGMSGATPYAVHDIAPVTNELNMQERNGERLFQKNCAFCHGADGTGKNWIGSFLEPHPRNLTNATFMMSMPRSRLKERIKNGIPYSSMPAWKGVLTDREIESIIAYISRVFHQISKSDDG